MAQAAISLQPLSYSNISDLQPFMKRSTAVFTTCVSNPVQRTCLRVRIMHVCVNACARHFDTCALYRFHLSGMLLSSNTKTFENKDTFLSHLGMSSLLFCILRIFFGMIIITTRTVCIEKIRKCAYLGSASWHQSHRL